MNTIRQNFIRRLTPLEIKAQHFAGRAHGEQVDDEGNNYMNAHVVPVACLLRMLGAPEKVICAAYLHDVLEDTKVCYEDLVEEFGLEIADLVHEVTKEGQKDSEGFYFPRLKSKEAILIKFADRLSNLSRMNSWTEERQEHYLRKSKFWKSEPLDLT